MTDQVSRSATLLVVCTAHFLMPFMMSAVGVALPAIGHDFNASAMQLGLVETTYVLSASIFLLAMGRMADIHGRRRIFQYGIVLFTLAGGLLSQAWSIESMIGMRFLQGMGGSMVMATTFAIVVSVFPPAERGKALGIAVASVYAGISCGPFFRWRPGDHVRLALHLLPRRSSRQHYLRRLLCKASRRVGRSQGRTLRLARQPGLCCSASAFDLRSLQP